VLKKKIWANFHRIIELFVKKIVNKLRIRIQSGSWSATIPHPLPPSNPLKIKQNKTYSGSGTPPTPPPPPFVPPLSHLLHSFPGQDPAPKNCQNINAENYSNWIYPAEAVLYLPFRHPRTRTNPVPDTCTSPYSCHHVMWILTSRSVQLCWRLRTRSVVSTGPLS
jgi:hypothetical protein